MNNDKLLKYDEVPKEVIQEIESAYSTKKIIYQMDGNISKTPELRKRRAKYTEFIREYTLDPSLTFSNKPVTGNLVTGFFIRVHEGQSTVKVIDIYSTEWVDLPK